MNILITGAASGIGRAVAELFLQRGHRVYGIDITPAQVRENFFPFTADITQEDALLQIRQTLTEEGVVLDAIVNIAGIHSMASLVESDYQRMRQVVEVNLCGTMLVNRVFHRCLGKQGRVLIVTSEVAGFDPMPFNGLYNVSKTALDCYGQALRQELNLIGQKVVTLRPGAVATPLSSGSMKATRDLAGTTVLYAKQAKCFSGLAQRFMGKPIAPERLAKLVFKAATIRHPRPVYAIHRNAGLVLLNLLPKSWQCGIIKFLLNTGWF